MRLWVQNAVEAKMFFFSNKISKKSVLAVELVHSTFESNIMYKLGVSLVYVADLSRIRVKASKK